MASLQDYFEKVLRQGADPDEGLAALESASFADDPALPADSEDRRNTTPAP